MTIRRPALRLVASLTDLAARSRRRATPLLAALAAVALAVACGETTGPTPDVVSSAHSTLSAPGAPVAAGGSATVTVQLRNAEGAPVRVAGTDVRVVASAGTVGPVTGGENGSYSVTVTTTVAGPVTLTATVNGQAVPGSVTVLFVAGPAAAITKLAGDEQNGVVGAALATAPAVRVIDAFGNTVGGATVTFATPTGSGSVTPASVATTTAGVATVTGWTLGTTPGTHFLTATVPIAGGATSGVTFSATAAAGAPAVVAKLAGDAQSAVAGSAVAVAPSIAVRDAFGNALPGVAVTVTVTGGGGTIVAPTTGVTGADGTFALVRWTLGTTAGANTVAVSAGGLPAVTFTAQGRAGAPASLAKQAGDAQTGVAGEALPIAPRVRLLDANGNGIANTLVRFQAAAGSGAAAEEFVQTDGSGLASTPWTLGATAGAHTLTASVGTVVATFTATGVPGAPATLEKTAGDAQTAVVGSAAVTAPQVRVLDARRNVVPGAVVTFAAATGSGTIAGATATADANGLATAGTWTLGTVAGANTLSATSGSATASFTATGVAGAPVQMRKTTGDAQTAVAGAAVSVVPTITLLDTYGNRVPNIAVTFAVTQGAGTLGATTAATDASGVASTGGWTLGVTMGANALTATAGSLTAAFTATGTAGAAAKLVKQAGDGQTLVAGSNVTLLPAVLVADAHDNPVAGTTVRFTVGSGAGTVTGDVATSGANGIATLGQWSLGIVAGTNTVVATSGDLAPATFTITGVAGAVATVTASAGDLQGALPGATLPVAPAVLARDVNGNPVAGQTVTFAVTRGGGSLASTTAVTGANGVATAGLWTLGTSAAEPQVVTATLGARTVQFNASVVAGPAAVLTRTAGDGQTTAVTTMVPTPPAVTLTDAYGNPIVGATVTFAATAPGSTVTGGVTTTNASGVATPGAWYLGNATGVQTLTATSGALSVTFSATATAGAPATLTRVAGDAQSAAAGSAVATAPSVRLRDAQGNPVAGATITFAVLSGGGSVTGATTVTDASGIATVGSWTLGTAVGANTLTATSSTLQVSFSATGVTGPAAQIGKGPMDLQSAVVGTAVPIAPWVLIADAHGNPVAGASVTFAASGTGSVNGSPVVTGANGIAIVGSWTLGTTAGSNTLTATSGALSATFTATGTAGAAAGLTKMAGDAQSATVATAVSVAPAVRLADANGNPIAGASVAFAVATGAGSVTGASTTTDASGIATVGGWTLGSAAGANSITATSGSLVVTFTATGTAAVASSLTKTAGDAQTATVGTAVPTAPAVRVTDQYGNPVAGTSVSFVASGGGSVAGSPALSDASGIATLGSWTVGTTPGAQTLTATVGSASVTFAATATTGGAANLVKSAGDAQSATVGTAVAVAPAVTVTDALGNPLAGVSVEFAPVSGGGTLGGFSATTNASGVATLGSWTLGTAAGANSITATAGSLSTTFTATGTPGAAANLARSAGDAQTATAGTAVSVAPSVRITDVYGNAIVGRSVTFAVATGGGSVSGGSTTTDASGYATLGSWTLGATGSNTVTASSSGLTTVTFTATATAPPPALIEIVQGDAQTANAGAAVATLPRVRVKDASGNVLSGVSVTFAVAGGGGSLTGATATTDASGLATVGSWTLGSGGAGCSAFAVTNCSRNALTASAATGTATPVSFKAYVPPAAYSATYQTVANATVSVPAANGLLFGALSINGNGPNGTGATLSLVGGTAPAGTTVTRSADGSFTVLTRSVGTVSYPYAVSDGIASTTASVTATIVASNIVWYVQQGATAAGADGSDANPYNSLATLETALGTRTNDVILVKNPSNTNIPGGTLKSGQTLYGQFASSPYTYTTGSTASYRNGGQTLTLLTNGGLALMDGVVLSTNNTISGINFQNATGTSITGTSFGVLTVSRVSVNSLAGAALDLSTGTLVGSFTDVNAAGGTYGVSLNNVATSGTVDLGSGNLTGASTGAFRVIGAGTPSQNLHNLTYAGTLNHSGAGRVIDIQNHAGGALTLSGNVFCSSSCQGMQVTGATGGTIMLSGTSKQLFAASGFMPVSLTNNTFTSIDFINGGLNVSGNGATGFYGNSGGTVTVTGTGNVFSGSSAKALDLQSTTIGAAGITAQSISASGGLNGIALNSTGTLGSLTVTGNGGTCTSAGTCTGGAIQSTSGNGVFLSSTLAPSFTRMYVGGIYRFSSVNGTGVNGFTFANGRIDYSGMTTGSVVNGTGIEDNIELVDATGTVSITGNTLTNALRHGVSVTSGNATLPSLTISNNTFTSGATTTLSKGSAVNIAMTSSGSFSGNVITGAISGNAITGFPSGRGIAIAATNANATGMAGVGIPSGGTAVSSYSGPQILTVSGNQIAGLSAANRMGGNAIYVSATGRAQSNVAITGNGTAAAPIQNAASSAIYLNAAGTIANVYATVANNYLASNGTSGGGIEGWSTQSTLASDNPLLSLVATGNVITNSYDNGIRLAANQAAGRLFARVENNSVSAPIGTSAPNYGIYVQSTSAGASNVCLRLRSNTTAGSTVLGTTYPGIGLARSSTATFGIDGLTPSPAATPTVENYVNSLNTSTSGNTGTSVGGTELRTTTTGYTSCTSAP